MHILFVSGIGGDTRRYRCDHHREQLGLHGIGSSLLAADDLQLYVAVTGCAAVILHRVAWSPLVADVVEVAHARGVPVVFETDDLVFAPEVFDRIAYLETLPPEQAQRFRADLAGQVQTFAACDCVLTTTEALAEAAEARGKAAYVQRNAASAAMLAAAAGAYVRRRQRLAAARVEQAESHTGGAAASTLNAAAGGTGAVPPAVIGYFSGTGSHNRDFATVAPVLAELMGRYPQVQLLIGGHLEMGGPLLAYLERIRRAPFVAWQELPGLVAQVDINLAPLELDNPFCQAKSEIKFTEAALVGVPTVASPTQAFAFAIAHGEDGLLAGSPAEWREALVALIEQPTLAEELGEAARRKVYARYSPEVAAPELVATLKTILSRHARDPEAPEAVLQLLAERMLQQGARREAELAQVKQQAEQLRGALAQGQGAADAQGAAFWRKGLEETEARQRAILQEILARLEQAGGADGRVRKP